MSFPRWASLSRFEGYERAEWVALGCRGGAAWLIEYMVGEWEEGRVTAAVLTSVKEVAWVLYQILVSSESVTNCRATFCCFTCVYAGRARTFGALQQNRHGEVSIVPAGLALNKVNDYLDYIRSDHPHTYSSSQRLLLFSKKNGGEKNSYHFREAPSQSVLPPLQPRHSPSARITMDEEMSKAMFLAQV
ncbi:hypothetical protein CPB84DRAFT_1749492 [Gymnopilus junonius]|uniref:Uncharacterized protein n=1 Tax=Gymnopilus junonius TaxID=109634 RepID=A0A9P5NJA7_GYMJU|nr:hypothetical protein CPB84DRAFT_1749492 [Gymnopilus junonius]